ncbi:hypothetical protein C8R43DRAFT_1241693 [Mycena crocata]|nr:hypothetical protein C8R43DRAFT_1241693 [Mycena crocata]
MPLYPTSANAPVPPSYISQPQYPCEDDRCQPPSQRPLRIHRAAHASQHASYLLRHRPVRAKVPRPITWPPLGGAPYSTSPVPQRRRRIRHAFCARLARERPHTHPKRFGRTTNDATIRHRRSSHLRSLAPGRVPAAARALAHHIDSDDAHTVLLGVSRGVIRASGSVLSVRAASPRASLGERSRASRVVRIAPGRVLGRMSITESHRRVRRINSIGGAVWVNYLQTVAGMKMDYVLPAHTPDKQLPSSSKVKQAPRSNPLRLNHIQKLWRVCTTTLDGSLSETFKIISTDGGDAASDVSKAAAIGGDGDSFLNAVIVDNDDYADAKAPPLHQPRSSRRSGHGESGDITRSGIGLHRFGLGGFEDGPHYYRGGLVPWIRHRGWPQVVNFFEPTFMEHEEEYQMQTWHSNKLLAFSASLFLVLNWVLYVILNNDSTKHTLYAKIFFWGAFTLLTLPTPFMVALDMPRRCPIMFQTWFCVAVWFCAFVEVIQIKQCHLFTNNHCFGKDFLAMAYYSTGYPALMMFIISKRLYNCIAQVIFFIFLLVLILPDQGIYARNIVSFVVFSIFIQGLHYTIENARRKMFLLALQLKHECKAKHQARLAESKASFTKRRFANYIFHEVRVPLNNAVLAFQLLQSGHAFKDNYAKSTEIYALEQGLRMMKTVLNDVLDFEKMDCGHFETIARPFPLHHSIRAILDQVEIQTGARQLVLERSLDEGIDRIPRLTAGAADEPEGLWVLGSELRLHQVLTNLAANTVKYTPERGGFIRIATEFLGIFMREELPDNPPDLEQRHDKNQRLFQPFFQTAVGQLSGSGTGLGLAIVKQIVKLSGGRLGVTSRRGEGSKFWIELSYPLASAAEIQAARDTNTLKSLPRTSYGSHNTASGFIPGPLIVFSPRETGKPSSEAADVTLEFATEAAASSPPAVTLPCSPCLEQRSLPLQSATPFTPLVTAVSSSDPLWVLVCRRRCGYKGALFETADEARVCCANRHGPGRSASTWYCSDPYNYDLICLDNFMPVMTGQEAVKELRANKRLDFIVGYTGLSLFPLKRCTRVQP